MDFEDGSFSIKIVWPYSVLMVVPNLPPEIEMGISVMKMHTSNLIQKVYLEPYFTKKVITIVRNKWH